MSVAARLLLFAVGLAVVLLAAFALGRAVGPVGDTAAPSSGTPSLTRLETTSA